MDIGRLVVSKWDGLLNRCCEFGIVVSLITRGENWALLLSVCLTEGRLGR